MEFKKLDASNLFIILNRDCNLNCEYCYEKKEPGEMSFFVLKKSIEALFNYNGMEKKKTITFFGGEPLLSKNLIYKVCSIVSKINNLSSKKIELFMSTNGLLLDSIFINNISKYNFWNNIQVSIDSFSFKNNKARVSTEEQHLIILKNLELLVNSKVNSVVHTVLGPHNISSFGEDTINFLKMGVKGIGHMYAMDANLFEFWHDENTLSIFKEQVKTIADFLLSSNGKYSVKNVKIFRDFSDDKFLFDRACGAGTNTFTVDVNGDIYPCYRFMYLKDKDRFKVGSVCDLSKLNTAILSEFYAPFILSKNPCMTCNAKNCAKCYAFNYLINKDISIQDTTFCVYNKILRDFSEYIYRNSR